MNIVSVKFHLIPWWTRTTKLGGWVVPEGPFIIS